VTGDPDQQRPEATGLLTQADRRSPDPGHVGGQILRHQPDLRVPPGVGPGGVEDRHHPAHAHRGRATPPGMLAAEVQVVRDLMERTVQCQFRHEGPVGVVVAAVVRHRLHDPGPDHAVDVVPAVAVEQAAEPRDGGAGVGLQHIRKLGHDVAVLVDGRRPGVRQRDLRSGVQCLDAALEQVRRVQVVVRGPLEVLSAGLPDHVGVVEGGAAVPRVPHVADPGVTRRVGTRDRLGGVGRGVVRDDQLEVRERLCQQRVQSRGEVVLPVVRGQTDGQSRTPRRVRCHETPLSPIRPDSDSSSRPLGGLEPEGGPRRVRLRRRELVEPVDERVLKLVQRCAR